MAVHLSNSTKNSEVQKVKNKKLHFCEFSGRRYYPETAQLVLDGETALLSGYSKDIFEMFLSRPGCQISKKEIIKKFWADKPCSIASFGKHIDKLRREIGDVQIDSDWQILNKGSRGFLIFQPQVKYRYHGLSPQYRILLVGVIFTVLLTVSILQMFKPETIQTVNPPPLTNRKGEITHPVASPDSKVIVYSRQSPNNSSWDLMVTRRGESTHRWLTQETKQDTYNIYASFSPSGQQLVWVRSDYRAFCEIITIDFDSISLTTSNRKTVYHCEPSQMIQTPQWLSESSLLMTSYFHNQPYGLVKLDLTTMEQTQITEPTDTIYGDYGVYYHAESGLAAYLRQSTGTGSELRIYNVNQQTHRLVKAYNHILYSVGWRNSEQLVVQSKDGFEILDLSGDSVRAKPIHFGEDETLQFPFIIDEQTIGFVQGPTMDRDILIHDLDGLSTSDELITIFDEHKVVLSKKSNSIIFPTMEKLKYRLYYKVGNRATPIVTLPRNARILDIATSPNDELIAYTLGNTLFVVDLHGKLLHQRSIAALGYAFSPDGKQLLIGQRFGKENSIISLSVEDDFNATQVTNGFLPKITQDGTLYFLRNVDGQAWLFRQTEASEEKLIKAPFPTMITHSNFFDVIDHSLFYIENENLIKQDLNSGEKVVIKKVKGNHFSMNYAQDFMVTTHAVTAQNNLIEFKLKFDDGSG